MIGTARTPTSPPSSSSASRKVDKRIVDGIGQTESRGEFAIEHRATSDHRQGLARGQGILQSASDSSAGMRLSESRSRPSAARATPRRGLGSCPTVGNMYDKLIPKGISGVFGETSEITGAEHIAKARADSRDRREVDEDVPGLSGRDDRGPQDRRSLRHQPTKGNIAAGFTTIEERRSATSRRSAASAVHRCARAGRSAGQGPGLYSWTRRPPRPNASR